MHNLEFILQNMRHKILWNFEIQTDHLISARRPVLVIINKIIKRTCQIVDFSVPSDHRVKLKKSEKKDKNLDLARELKKKKTLWNISCNQCSWYSHQRIRKKSGRIGNKSMSGEHSNYSTVKMGQNTEKSPGDLLSLRL